jgi:hypothetical protein
MPDQLRFLEAKDVRAEERPGSVGLRVEIVGEQTILNAQIRRAFPLSGPTDFISIRDGAGTEVGILRSMEGLDPTTRELFEHELDRRYFTPIIDRIYELEMEAGMWRFRVSTQRGPAEFFVRNWRDNAHELSSNRWHINTVDGGRFEIKDVEALDTHSRRLMDQIL